MRSRSETVSVPHRLAEDLRERIGAGELAPGEKLPSEPELARSWEVSRASVRAAMAILEEQGLMSRRHGSGTYVTHWPAPPNELSRNFGVSSLIEATGMQAGTVEQAVGIVPAPPAVAVAFGVEPGSPVNSLRRVRTANGRRVVDTIDWCRTEDLDPDELRKIGDGSVYDLLASTGLTVHHGVAELTPANADAEIATRLQVARGALILTIDQVDSTASGVAILVSREHHLAEAFSFVVVRKGPPDLRTVS